MMNISNTINTQLYGRQMPNAAKKSENIRFNDVMKPEGEDKVLEYYHKLCKDYPDISFRLDDTKGVSAHSNYMGYNNSMNQIGDNFGKFGQCSVYMDADVIKHMMENPNYEMKVKARIEEAQEDWSVYEDETRRCNMKATDLGFEDNNGSPQAFIERLGRDYPTEQEKATFMKNAKDIDNFRIRQMLDDLNVSRYKQLYEMLGKKHMKK